MSIDLTNYGEKACEAVKAFWGARDAALKKSVELGRAETGSRGAVTAGKNMDGFESLVLDIVRANGLTDATIRIERRVLSLPGFFRPTKLWDLLILHHGRLVAALEFKSQVGPSFGNNANNRTEEAIGTALDLWTAYREGAFGDIPRPFVGYLFHKKTARGLPALAGRGIDVRREPRCDPLKTSPNSFLVRCLNNT